MEKNEMLSQLWNEAEKITKARLIIIRICVTGLVIILSYVVLMLYFYPSPNSWVVTSWPLYLFYLVLFLLSIFSPTGQISKEKIEIAFYPLAIKAAQEHVNKVAFIYKKVINENLDLEALKTLNDIYSEILKENTEQMKKSTNLIKDKRK